MPFSSVTLQLFSSADVDSATQEEQRLQALLRLTRTEVQRCQKGRRLYYGVWLTIPALSLVSLLFLAHLPPWVRIFNAFTMALSMLWQMVGLPLISFPRKQKAVLRELAGTSDLRALGTLLEVRYPVIRTEDRVLCTAVDAALVRLLPGLSASSPPRLTTQQRECLYATLLAPENPALVLAALQAVIEVGDSRAVARVQKLAAGKGAAQKNEQIRCTAQGCLIVLQQRQTQMASGEQLLRASDTTYLPPATLLRAAQERDTPSEHLVRPADEPSPQ